MNFSWIFEKYTLLKNYLFFQSINYPEADILTWLLGAPYFVPYDSTILTTSSPLVTFPKTTCLPFKWGQSTVVIKNYEPLVFGPAFAMLKTNFVFLYIKFSSLNLFP
jgi:hypothetical protein